MIDIALLRNDPDVVRRSVSSRGSDVDVDKLIEVDAELRQKTVQAEQLRSKQKTQPRGGQVDIEAAKALKE
ncbi:hypothetical protein [Saccharothrix sp. ALI-22-I]|uniref:hypothetical protein n=1 Tax=Saccharothrix sp. ALI-22-I TaxID=1933778 RepID=UPI0015C39D87|nr:hypothetical protein [Saccharothrix sp. ALI-22-I]